MAEGVAAVAAMVVGALISGAQQRSAAKKARGQQHMLMQSAYEGNLENWERTNEQIDQQIDYLTQVAENPGEMSPEYKNLKNQLNESSAATTQDLQDTLRRAGLSGGKQIKVEQEVAEEAQGRLAEALTYISDQARSQIHEANLARPLKPYFGQGAQNYQPYMPEPLDLSALGMLAAQSMANAPDESKRDVESTTQRTGTVAQPSYDFYQQLGMQRPGRTVWPGTGQR